MPTRNTRHLREQNMIRPLNGITVLTLEHVIAALRAEGAV